MKGESLTVKVLMVAGIGLVIGAMLAITILVDRSNASYRAQPCSAFANTPLRDVPARCIKDFSPKGP